MALASLAKPWRTSPSPSLSSRPASRSCKLQAPPRGGRTARPSPLAVIGRCPWHGQTLRRERAARFLVWFVAAGALWIAGGLADGSIRTVLWLAALALDYAAPLVTFWVPGRRRLRPEVWEVGTEHFAERFQLFIVIALGETIVINGATTSGLELATARVIAFGLAFLATAALWWLYFSLVATIAERRLPLADNRTGSPVTPTRICTW